jgi:hypothetical protein
MNFQTKLKRQLEAQGYTVLKVIRLSENGYPDLLAMKAGEPDRWIECKEGNDTLKPLQKLRIDQLNELGKIAYCQHDTKGIIYGMDSSK